MNFNNNSTQYQKNKKPSEKKIQKEIKKMSEILNKKEPTIMSKKIDNVELNKNKIDKTLVNKNNVNNRYNNLPKNNNAVVDSIEFPINNLPKQTLNNNNLLIQNLNSKLQNENKITKIESLEYALPEINLFNRKIEYFYPYFLKTNLLDLQNNNKGFLSQTVPIDFRKINNNLQCLDPLCEYCDQNNTVMCLQCLPGHFLLDGKCFISCPVNFLADVYKRECVPTTMRQRGTFSRVSYLKAFSVGICKNICGFNSIDCSCKPECLQFGNCCSDYRECEVLNRVNSNKPAELAKINPTCELFIDITNPQRCGQCKPGYFLFKETCIPQCAEKAIKENMICLNNQRCLVENCSQCEDGNQSVCTMCNNGFFLLNNQCHLSCPGTLRADRMNWTCTEPSVFAWYWIFPSKTSCRNKCEIGMVNNQDCSCRRDCINYGNCCQDFEDYCF